MPKHYPKHSERVNFFFAIHDMGIPARKRFNPIQKLQTKISKPGKISDALERTLNLAASVERDLNWAIQPETRSDQIQNLRGIFVHFFSCAEKIFEERMTTKLEQLDAILSLLNSTVSIINAFLEDMDNTWLANYGSISSEYLEYKSPIEFLEILPIAEKFLGKNFKMTVEKLVVEQSALRSIHDLVTKTGGLKSYF